MPGIILPPEMSGNPAATHAGLRSTTSTVSQKFSALFHGQPHRQGTLSADKNHRLSASRPKERGTNKGDNVTQLLSLLSPAPTVLPPLASLRREVTATRDSRLLQTSVTTGQRPTALPPSAAPQPLPDLLFRHSGIQPQQHHILAHLAQPHPRQAATPASAMVNSAHSPLTTITARQARDITQIPSEQPGPSLPPSVGVPAAIAVPHSHLRPAVSESKTTHPSVTPLPAPGSDPLPRDALKLMPATVVATPDSPQWQQQLSQQVLMMHHKGIQSAELRLHPHELGNLKISLVIKSDQAEMTFISGHSQVRTAIEAALPHLKTALAENGISLGESHVGSDDSASAMFTPSGGFGEKQPDTTRSGQGFTEQASPPATLLSLERSPPVASAISRVDLFV